MADFRHFHPHADDKPGYAWRGDAYLPGHGGAQAEAIARLRVRFPDALLIGFRECNNIECHPPVAALPKAKRPVACDICPAILATTIKRTRYGVFAACAEHEKNLAGWIADARHEAICDAKAAASFEDRAYGRDR